MLKPNLQCDVAFGKKLGHERRALMDGIGAFIKEISQNFFIPPTTGGHNKKTVYEPGDVFSALKVNRKGGCRKSECRLLSCQLFSGKEVVKSLFCRTIEGKFMEGFY